MGTRVSKQDIKVPHFFFGEVSHKNEFNRDLMTVAKKMLRRDEYDEWLRLYLQVKTWHKQSLLIPQSHQIEAIKKYFTCCECPADFEMSICYERFEHLFKEELVQRKKNKQFYRQEELFLILYNFLIGLKEFQINGKRFGDIRPAQIVITNQKDLKLINLASFPWQITSFQKILDKLDNATIFYLSPEEIDCLKKKTRNASYPNSKTEAFSLGVTILQAALLQSSEQLYTVNPRTLDIQSLERRIVKLQKDYPQLKGYLTLLLLPSPSERFSAGQLWSMLKIYSQKILERNKFNRNVSQQNANLAQFRKKSQR